MNTRNSQMRMSLLRRDNPLSTLNPIKTPLLIPVSQHLNNGQKNSAKDDTTLFIVLSVLEICFAGGIFGVILLISNVVAAQTRYFNAE